VNVPKEGGPGSFKIKWQKVQGGREGGQIPTCSTFEETLGIEARVRERSTSKIQKISKKKGGSRNQSFGGKRKGDAS